MKLSLLALVMTLCLGTSGVLAVPHTTTAAPDWPPMTPAPCAPQATRTTSVVTGPGGACPTFSCPRPQSTCPPGFTPSKGVPSTRTSSVGCTDVLIVAPSACLRCATCGQYAGLWP